MKKIPSLPIGSEAQSAETGSWRTFKPVIRKEECKKCGSCATYCPDGVILKTKDGFEIDYVFCKGCGICSTECPSKAIVMVLEEK